MLRHFLLLTATTFYVGAAIILEMTLMLTI